jgi:K+-transporting ATPase KdpF subunit
MRPAAKVTTTEETVSADSIIGAVVSVVTLIYLVYTLLRPERF